MEIDSIYSKLVDYQYFKRENIVLKEALAQANLINTENTTQLSLYKANQQDYQSMVEKYNQVNANFNEQLAIKKQLLSTQKKKKWKNLLLGFGLGSAATLLLVL